MFCLNYNIKFISFDKIFIKKIKKNTISIFILNVLKLRKNQNILFNL